jgi:hypothetical protein
MELEHIYYTTADRNAYSVLPMAQLRLNPFGDKDVMYKAYRQIVCI